MGLSNLFYSLDLSISIFSLIVIMFLTRELCVTFTFMSVKMLCISLKMISTFSSLLIAQFRQQVGSSIRAGTMSALYRQLAQNQVPRYLNKYLLMNE